MFHHQRDSIFSRPPLSFQKKMSKVVNPLPHISFEPVGNGDSGTVVSESEKKYQTRLAAKAKVNTGSGDINPREYLTTPVFLCDGRNWCCNMINWIFTLRWLLLVVALVLLVNIGMGILFSRTVYNNFVELPLTGGYGSFKNVGGTIVMSTVYTTIQYSVWWYGLISGALPLACIAIYACCFASLGGNFAHGRSPHLWILYALAWFEFTMWAAHVAGFTDVFAIVGASMIVLLGMGNAYLHERTYKYKTKVNDNEDDASAKIPWNSFPLLMFLMFTMVMYAYILPAVWMTTDLPSAFSLTVYTYLGCLFLFQVVVMWHWWINLKRRDNVTHLRYIRRMHWWLLLLTMITHTCMTANCLIVYDPPVWDTSMFWISV